MNHLYDLNLFENVEALVEQIEKDYIVSEDNKSVLLKQVKAYFWFKKQNSLLTAAKKWSEISKMLDSCNMKVGQ